MKGVVVTKNIEIVGESDKDWTDAVKVAVKEAAKTLRGISRVKVLSLTAAVKDNQIVAYRARVKVTFTVERE